MSLLSSPLIIAIAAAFALCTQLWVLLRLARRFASIPARVPLRLRLDGRPRATGSKRGLWIAPLTTLTVTVVLGAAVLAHPPPYWQDVIVALAFLICAEVGWFIAWTIDRQVEIARGMTVRIAPRRIVALAFPLVATIAVAIVEAIAQSL